MALTRATKEKRLASLETQRDTALEAARRHRARAEAADELAKEKETERAWLAMAPTSDGPPLSPVPPAVQAPVSDPEDEAGGGEG